jgi:hypothetical protein
MGNAHEARKRGGMGRNLTGKCGLDGWSVVGMALRVGQGCDRGLRLARSGESQALRGIRLLGGGGESGNDQEVLGCGRETLGIC